MGGCVKSGKSAKGFTYTIAWLTLLRLYPLLLLEISLSWEGLSVKHRRRRHGGDAKGQKQHLWASRGTTIPL